MAGDSMGTCPLGGLWYTCTAQNPTFFGCCTSNPCNGVGCPESDLRAAGMGTASGPDIGVPNDGSYWPNVKCSTGLWWTCALQTPSFQGCCESNPCGGSGTGCPAGKLHAAAFSSVTSAVPTRSTTITTSAKTVATPSTIKSAVKDSSTVSSTPSASQQLYTSTLANGATTTATVIIIQTSAPDRGDSNIIPSPGPNIAAVAGGAAGGAVVFLILAFAIWWNCRKRKRNREEQNARLASAYETSRSPPGAPVRIEEKKIDIATANEHEAYYPGQPIFGVPSPTKIPISPNLINLNSPPVTPGPPPYRSPNAQAIEIDSRDIHEASSGYAANSAEPPRVAAAQELESSNPDKGKARSPDVDAYAAELPASPNLQHGSRWSLRRPVGLGQGMGARGRGERGSAGTGVSEVSGEDVRSQTTNKDDDRGVGNRGSGGSASVVSAASPMRGSYTAWESWER